MSWTRSCVPFPPPRAAVPLSEKMRRPQADNPGPAPVISMGIKTESILGRLKDVLRAVGGLRAAVGWALALAGQAIRPARWMVDHVQVASADPARECRESFTVRVR